MTPGLSWGNGSSSQGAYEAPKSKNGENELMEATPMSEWPSSFFTLVPSGQKSSSHPGSLIVSARPGSPGPEGQGPGR